MLSINSIKKGIVIDHIKCGMGYEIFQLLHLDEADYTVALIMNASSKKKGRKDMIKIENVLELDLDVLGVIDDDITINIIDRERIIEKRNVNLPTVVENFLICSNPRCITNSEKNVKNKFTLINREERKYNCVYCDHIYGVEEE